MAISTLAQIRKKVRRLTASPDEYQLSTTDIDEYINVFYEQDMPSNLKVWNLKTTFEFPTTPNVDRYDTSNVPFDINTFHTVEQPIYCDGYLMDLDLDQATFYNKWPFLNTQSQFAIGNGTSGPYTITLSGIPVLRRNITISASDNTGAEMVIWDTGGGSLSDFNTTLPVRGSINYVTGAITALTFPNSVPNGGTITVRSVPYSASRPVNLLYFNNYLVVRPVPDKVYRVTMTVYRKPTQFINDDPNTNPQNVNGTAQVQRWWQYLAYGAAIKVLQDRMDMDEVEAIRPFLKEQERYIIYETAAQNHLRRANTIYSDGNTYPGNYGQFPGAF